MPELSAISELESALAGLPPERRARILQRIVDAFVPLADKLDDRHIDVFDQIICSLIVEAQAETLVELWRRLAPLRRTPNRTVRRLALSPDVAIAGPILAECEQLSLDALAEAAASGSPQHLRSLAGRSRLEPAVTDVLVRRADIETLRILAANPEATFSQPGYAILAEQAAGDAATAEKIIQRPDCAPDHLQVMVVQADEDVRAHLIGAAPASRRPAVEQLIAQLSDQVTVPESAGNEQYYAHTIARLKQAHGSVTEKEVAAFAAGKKTGEATAALSMVSGIPPETVEDLLDQARLEPFLMMCKAVHFHWTTVRALLELYPRPGRPMQDFLTEACNDFTRLSPSVSQQALRLWQRRGAAAS